MHSLSLSDTHTLYLPDSLDWTPSTVCVHPGIRTKWSLTGDVGRIRQRYWPACARSRAFPGWLAATRPPSSWGSPRRRRFHRCYYHSPTAAVGAAPAAALSHRPPPRRVRSPHNQLAEAPPEAAAAEWPWNAAAIVAYIARARLGRLRVEQTSRGYLFPCLLKNCNV